MKKNLALVVATIQLVGGAWSPSARADNLTTPSPAAGEIVPTNPKFKDKKLLAQWPAKPPAAASACWNPTAGVSGAGLYALKNATPPCSKTLRLAAVPITIAQDGSVTFGGKASTGDVHALDATGKAVGVTELIDKAKADQELSAGLIFGDDKGVYVPSAITPLPTQSSPASPSPVVATPSKVRYDSSSKEIVADWQTPPSVASCWSPIGAAAPTTYVLSAASAQCSATLHLTPVAITVNATASPVSATFAGNPSAGTIHTLNSSGGVDKIQLGGLTAGASEQLRSDGVLFVDDNGAYVPSKLTTSSAQNVPSTSAATCPAWPTEDEYAATSNDGNAHISIDLPRGSVVLVPARNVIRPNQGLTVHVCHESGKDIAVAWGGKRGLTSPATNVQTGATFAESVTGTSPAAPVDVSEVHFSPRQPGQADLTITTGSGSSAKTLTVELQVDTLYWGSIRIGLGTLFDVAGTWKGYSVGTISGSQQPEVVQTHSVVAFDLVSGFAPYLFDLFCPGHGRSYTGGCDAFVAPFFGFGVVGTNATQSVQALSSFHIGLEVEFANNFSVATTVVVRRTQTLLGGYIVGSPVSNGMTAADVTQDYWSPGFALVINATPSFLQFALGSGSSSKPTTTSSPSAGAGITPSPSGT